MGQHSKFSSNYDYCEHSNDCHEWYIHQGTSCNPISEISWPHVWSRLGGRIPPSLSIFRNTGDTSVSHCWWLSKGSQEWPHGFPKKSVPDGLTMSECVVWDTPNHYLITFPIKHDHFVILFWGPPFLGTPTFGQAQRTAAPKERLFQAYVQRTPSFVRAVDLLTSKGGEIHNVTWRWDGQDRIRTVR